MVRPYTVGVVSDIHYASAAEQARGRDYELQGLSPALRLFVKCYRRFVWLRDPLHQNHLLARFLHGAEAWDCLVANGDFSCDSAYLGVSDDAACQSARECLAALRGAFGERLHATFGDHELGKLSFFGGRGGLRLASWHRARQDLGLEPFWQVPLGNYVLLGVTSTLIALPVFQPDILPAELEEWQRLRAEHLDRIRQVFCALAAQQRVVLFCHDPTALPFLGEEACVQSKLPQIEHTIIGHLHSNLILWKSRLLSGMPTLGFLGHTVRRMSTALNRARHWRPFHVRLCPALAGIQLLNDGGYLALELDPDARRPACLQRHYLPR